MIKPEAFDSSSNVKILTKYKHPEVLKNTIVNIMLAMAFPHVELNRIREVINREESIDETIEILNNL